MIRREAESTGRDRSRRSCLLPATVDESESHGRLGLSAGRRVLVVPTGATSTSRAASAGRRISSACRLTGGAVEQVTKGERRIGAITFDRDFKRSPTRSAARSAGRDLRREHRRHGREAADARARRASRARSRSSKAERLRCKSKDGTPIEGWLLYPHGYDAATGARIRSSSPATAGRTAPTGYSFDFKKQYFAANGYFVLDTNFRSSTGYGDKFKWATWGAWGTKDGEDVMSGRRLRACKRIRSIRSASATSATRTAAS